MNKELQQRIKMRAWEIYEWRVANGISGCALGDWLESESEVITDRRGMDGCPLCNSKLLAKENNKIICLMCKWSVDIKRKSDEEIADFKEIKSRWQ